QSPAQLWELLEEGRDAVTISERILEQSEIDLLSAWVDAEGPAGDTTLAPVAPIFSTGSQLGTPSSVLTMLEPFTIPGDYTDHYQVFVLPANLLIDRDVTAIEFRPGNAKVVHHVFIYTCEDGSAAALDATTPEYGYPSFGGAGEGVNADFLGLYAPGLQARFYPPGSGVKFKAGTDVLIQVHYAPVTQEATDQSSVNIFYTSQTDLRKVKAKRVGEQYITEPVFFIPKNKVLTFHNIYPLDTTYSIFSIAPHMHLIGKDFKIWAETPDGDSIPLINIPKWDFNWQMLYSYPFMIKLPEGTQIYSEASYDNTENNPNNPNNPPLNIGYGESSKDEMFKYFMNLLPYMPGDEDIVLDSSWHPVGVAPIEGIVTTPQLYGPSPNPATHEVALTYYLPTSTSFALYVYDLSGRLVTTVKEAAITGAGMHKNVIDVSSFMPGTYFCTLVCDGKKLTKKFIVQH
ncbi:MAG TPA: T9SS type A sorting domain-containing protein, partial [Chitinophagales bacterium]|nr:T9SS type A sorting domain-containing protein [Chitinophagales bacterium]